jgi:hypothetical protein
VRYASGSGFEIAYQVLGNGPHDVVWVAGAVTHLDVMWDHPGYRRFCEQLASFSRLILFDKRGMGLSERTRAGTLEERMDDPRSQGRTRCAASLSASAAARSIRPETAYWPASTGLHAPSAARAPRSTPSAGSGSRFAPECTPASARSTATSWLGSPSTSACAWPAAPPPARSLSPARYATSSRGSGLEFEERGSAELKGVPGEWRLYAVSARSTAGS